MALNYLYFPCHIRVLACFHLGAQRACHISFLNFSRGHFALIYLNKSKQLGCCGVKEEDVPLSTPDRTRKCTRSLTLWRHTVLRSFSCAHEAHCSRNCNSIRWAKRGNCPAVLHLAAVDFVILIVLPCVLPCVLPGQLRSQRKQKSHEQNRGAGRPKFQVPGRAGVDLWGPEQSQWQPYRFWTCGKYAASYGSYANQVGRLCMAMQGYASTIFHHASVP